MPTYSLCREPFAATAGSVMFEANRQVFRNLGLCTAPIFVCHTILFVEPSLVYLVASSLYSEIQTTTVVDATFSRIGQSELNY